MCVKVALTGPPGVGKTTVFGKVVRMLRAAGVRVDGFMCPEVRVHGRRVGFDMVDIITGKRVALSRLCTMAGGRGVVGRVGRYCVFGEAGHFGCKVLERALRNSDVVGVDEVGPMELMIGELRNCIYGVLGRRGVNTLLVVHRRVIRDLSTRFSDIRVFWIDKGNRDSMPNTIYNILTEAVNAGNQSI